RAIQYWTGSIGVNGTERASLRITRHGKSFPSSRTRSRTSTTSLPPDAHDVFHAVTLPESASSQRWPWSFWCSNQSLRLSRLSSVVVTRETCLGPSPWSQRSTIIQLPTEPSVHDA